MIKGLYLITDGKDNLVERVTAALAGGVSVLQYRAKDKPYSARVTEGKTLRNLCREKEVFFIVNDDPGLARELDADGVHLGQEDGTVSQARAILGREKAVGRSTHSVKEAVAAEAEGADYIGFGAMFPTGSKEVRHMPGPEALESVKRSVSIPVAAIGGITRDNAGAVIDAGADATAVISAILSDSQPGTAAAELSLLFNRRAPIPRGSVMTIAGSDSGGGAGIQADTKTVTLLGSYASTAITALTAQNTMGVSGIYPVPASFIADQVDAILTDIPVDVVKTGMLLSPEAVVAVAEKIACHGKKIVVVDPVMVAKGGSRLMEEEAIAAVIGKLLPLAYVVTPNIPEAEALTGIPITDEDSMVAAGQAILSLGARNVLIKGGHLAGPEAVDILCERYVTRRFPAPRIESGNTHGTGCSYASAIAAFLAQGSPLPEVVARAKGFISAAIASAVPLGRGHGPLNHYTAAKQTS